MNWISVNDELPKKFGVYYGKIYEQKQLLCYSPLIKKWTILINGMWYACLDVTEWSEIEPPEDV